jgi:hypothetical protein
LGVSRLSDLEAFVFLLGVNAAFSVGFDSPAMIAFAADKTFNPLTLVAANDDEGEETDSLCGPSTVFFSFSETSFAGYSNRNARETIVKTSPFFNSTGSLGMGIPLSNVPLLLMSFRKAFMVRWLVWERGLGLCDVLYLSSLFVNVDDGVNTRDFSKSDSDSAIGFTI